MRAEWKRTALFAVFALALVAGAAPSLNPDDLSKERVLPKSTSPNGQLCFVEGYNGLTTATAIVLASTDMRQVFADAALATLYTTDKPYRGRITILWSSDSTRVATHDSIGKHSTLSILRSAGDAFTPVPCPDLFQAACQRWGIRRETVISSGQRPTIWTADDTLSVEVSAKLQGQKKRITTFQLTVPKEGPVVIKPK